MIGTDRPRQSVSNSVFARVAINGGIAVPEPWDQKRIAGLTEAMLELLDAADLEDDAADEVCEILLSKQVCNWFYSY